jgi:hypothetical protein
MKTMNFKYVTVKKCGELTGFTENAIRKLKTTGRIRKDLHWIKTPNGRIMIHVENFNRFLEGKG